VRNKKSETKKTTNTALNLNSVFYATIDSTTQRESKFITTEMINPYFPWLVTQLLSKKTLSS